MRARLPDRLRIDATSDRNQRQFFYDGETVTIFAPEVGAYAALRCSSKNCSSSVEPFSAAVEDCASIVVVTASK